MTYFTGIDVSLRSVSICVVDERGMTDPVDGFDGRQEGFLLRYGVAAAGLISDRPLTPPTAGPPRRQLNIGDKPSQQRYFVSRNSSIPWCDPSRPSPLCLTPPNGATSFEIKPQLIPIIPDSIAAEARQMRAASRL